MWNEVNPDQVASVEGAMYGLEGTEINAIPVMTSNTAPSGTASASHNNADAWKAFDGDADTSVGRGSILPGAVWVRYDSPAPVNIGKAEIYYSISGSSKLLGKVRFEGSNDGSAWTELCYRYYDFTVFSSAGTFTFPSAANVQYSKYRIYFALSGNFSAIVLDFKIYAIRRPTVVQSLMFRRDGKVDVSASVYDHDLNDFEDLTFSAISLEEAEAVNVSKPLSAGPQQVDVSSGSAPNVQAGYTYIDGLCARTTAGLKVTDMSGNGPLVNNGGIVTNASQSAVIAGLSGDQTITITGAILVNFNTVRVNRGANFNVSTYTYTAPVTCLALVCGALRIENIDTAAAYYQVWIVTSNKTYIIASIDPGKFTADVGYWSIPFSQVVDLDVNDTCSIQVVQNGGTQQSSIKASDRSWLSIVVLC